MKRRHYQKNFHEKKSRDFYRQMDRLKKRPVVEYVKSSSPDNGAGELRKQNG